MGEHINSIQFNIELKNNIELKINKSDKNRMNKHKQINN